MNTYIVWTSSGVRCVRAKDRGAARRHFEKQGLRVDNVQKVDVEEQP